MSPLLATVGAVALLLTLLLWARRRAASIRLQAAEREQRAMEDLLAARVNTVGRPAAPVGAPAAPRAEPAAAPDDSHHEAEDAAADLDPLEELISHIMTDTPSASNKLSPSPSALKRRAPGSVRYRSEADSIGAGVPLRELVLAWYESRGYRGSPASPAVWPIELVLRHRDDAARAYAFVVQNDYVSEDRITALIGQARDIGMQRVAVVAEAGYEKGAKKIARKQRVRLIDRTTMEEELLALELPTAAKIIAVARKRAEDGASLSA